MTYQNKFSSCKLGRKLILRIGYKQMHTHMTFIIVVAKERDIDSCIIDQGPK